ncbi:MAG: efflux RND transporter permease subunit, partial [Myxococcales bacterium]|nr:efflux RND transporter permease subunit [Myxococcales bacterium]
DGDGDVVVGELSVRAARSDRAALDEVLTAAAEVVPPSVEIIRLDPKETLEISLRVPVGGLTPGEGPRALAASIARALENLGHRPWALELGGDGDGSPLPAGEGRLLLRAEVGATAEVLAALRVIPGVNPRRPPADGALQTAALVVRGDDLESLREVSDSLAVALRAIPGIADVDVLDDVARPELAVRVDAARAAAVGVDSTEVSRAVTAVLSGIEIAAGQPGARPRVLLRVQAADSDDRVARLAGIVLPRSDGGVVRIADVADIEMVASPAAIRRSDGRRAMTIEMTLAGGAGAVEGAIKEAIAEHELPLGVTVELPSSRSR